MKDLSLDSCFVLITLQGDSAEQDVLIVISIDFNLLHCHSSGVHEPDAAIVILHELCLHAQEFYPRVGSQEEGNSFAYQVAIASFICSHHCVLVCFDLACLLQFFNSILVISVMAVVVDDADFANARLALHHSLHVGNSLPVRTATPLIHQHKKLILHEDSQGAFFVFGGAYGVIVLAFDVVAEDRDLLPISVFHPTGFY
mmetsp:Transcript_6402/g.11135  ORF Transcript_6402/g.11135 Transcript_6402/m.11135 type:complete len:200 (-) Transcript_6402:445-1044(-)